ncbi:hypothetical protein LJC07_04245 [Christensenellaceae bacterium OttesenSCG-928-L17]|nr:hypothetical protein [Christensenellaceae bacterium OttesenSCG-928-L17]
MKEPNDKVGEINLLLEQLQLHIEEHITEKDNKINELNDSECAAECWRILSLVGKVMPILHDVRSVATDVVTQYRL